MQIAVNSKYRLYRRKNGVYYAHEHLTGKQTSLKTKARKEAQRILAAKNEASIQPALNLKIARAYLNAADENYTKRTWKNVMDKVLEGKQSTTAERWERACKQTVFELIRQKPLMETRSEDLLNVITKGTTSTNVFLRRLHNFAIDMSWLPAPILPKKQWPGVRSKPKRAITQKEHEAIVAREHNPERRAFYELCWHLGGSQSDIANLSNNNIDRERRTVSFQRQKTGKLATLRYGDRVAEILEDRPAMGPLFPRLSQMHEKHRAQNFKIRCRSLEIEGVTLHCYRYAWAERAKQPGYPERYAMEALGHNSAAIHRVYAKGASLELPPLEEFEKETVKNIVSFPKRNVR